MLGKDLRAGDTISHYGTIYYVEQISPRSFSHNQYGRLIMFVRKIDNSKSIEWVADNENYNWEIINRKEKEFNILDYL